jgi:hypothetical protein
VGLFHGGQDGLKVCAKAAKCFESLRRGVDGLLLGLEDLAAFFLSQNSDRFSQTPTGRAQHLKSTHGGHKQSDAIVTYYPYALGKAIKCLEFESGEINTLKLFGGIRHEEAFGDWPFGS